MTTKPKIAPSWFDREWNPIGNLPHMACCAMFAARARISQLAAYPRPMRLLFAASDLFHAIVPDEVIRDMYLVMANHPRHTFLVITSNAVRMEQWFGTWAASEVMDKLDNRKQPFPAENIYLGVAIDDQGSLDDRLGALASTPAVHRLAVIHEMSDHLDLTAVQCPMGHYEREITTSCQICLGNPEICTNGRYNALRDMVDEVIVTKHRFRSERDALIHMQRFESIHEQCRLNQVPFIYT